MKLTWKDVFDSSKVYYGYMGLCMEVVRKAGYKYFVWNDRIYKIDDSGNSVMVGDMGLLEG